MSSSSAFRVRGAELRPATIPIAGFKHLLGPLFAASVAARVDLGLRNVPKLEETATLRKILGVVGASTAVSGGCLRIRTGSVGESCLPVELTARIHGGVYMIPAVLGRTGRVTFGRSGGCPIAGKGRPRPIHHVLGVLEAFGARFESSGGQTTGYTDGLRATHLDVADWSDSPHGVRGPLISGATKTAIIAALAADGGTTVIRNPYRKGDARELLSFARSAGWSVDETGDEYRIGERPGAKNIQVEKTLIPDLSEIITFVACATHTRTPLSLTGVDQNVIRDALTAEFEILEAMGVGLQWQGSVLNVRPPESMFAAEIDVTPDGIYSDHAPFFALMGCSATGKTVIRERVWRTRFSYAHQMRKLGADMSVLGDRLEVRPRRLSGTHIALRADDLRAAAVLILASLRVAGPVRVSGVHHLARGYENFATKLRSIGADLEEIL